MAPFFGASTIVWANTIGVVLVALSVGYWLGGRLGDRHPHLRGLCLRRPGRRGAARGGPVRRPAVLRRLGRRARRDLGRRLRRLAGRRPGADRGPGDPARRLLALGDAARGPRRRARGPRRRPPLRDLDRRLAARDDALGAGADPVRRDPAHLPRLRARAGARRGAGLGWRYVAVPAALAAVDRAPVGTVKATERRDESSTRARPRTSTCG